MSESTPVVEMTAADFFESLTGYDEHAIRKAWNGAVVGKLAKEDPFTWLRTLVFIHYRREKHPDPKHDALSMTTGKLQAFFLEDKSRNPQQQLQLALAAVLEAGDLDTAKAAARGALEGTGATGGTEDTAGGGAPGEAE